jgi:hypothetical protein
MSGMSKKAKSQKRGKHTAFLSVWVEPRQLEALRIIQAEVGILRSEQIRRAIDDWIARFGRKQK